MKLLNEPLNNRFLECIEASNISIKLCAPFVKKQIIDNVYGFKKQHTELELVTNINLMNFYKNSSDISALKIINDNNGIIYNFQRLHAKIYIFDNKYSIITSANLTPSGLSENYEYGVFLEEEALVKQICSDYASICANEDVNKINADKITEIEELLSCLPKHKEMPIPNIEFEKDEVCDGVIDIELLANNKKLVGWKKSLVESLNIVEAQTFNIGDCKKIAPILQSQYPQNHNIDAKIRQILQQLRDIGLIKFEGNGIYTKLWK